MPNRRDFLKTAAAGAAATSALSLSAQSYGQVAGANEHIDIANQLVRENRGVAPVAVCDVWDGNAQLSRGTGRGLYPSARKCGLNVDDRVHVTKDYRRILEQRDVHVVCIAAPDHWHAKMAIDAAAAGKHIYCEKP